MMITPLDEVDFPKKVAIANPPEDYYWMRMMTFVVLMTATFTRNDTAALVRVARLPNHLTVRTMKYAMMLEYWMYNLTQTLIYISMQAIVNMMTKMMKALIKNEAVENSVPASHPVVEILGETFWNHPRVPVDPIEEEEVLHLDET